MQERRQPEIIAGSVAQAGTVSTGDGFSVNKTGTGTYAVTFAPGFRFVSATVNITGGSGAFAQLSAITSSSVTFLTLTTAAALVDAPFAFVAVGVQT